MQMIKLLLIVILIAVFILIMVKIMTQNITDKLIKQQEINQKLIGLYQNQKDHSETLLRIIYHIRRELSLLNLKGCPDEERINIPNEIIDWINQLERINNGEDNGVHKQI